MKTLKEDKLDELILYVVGGSHGSGPAIAASGKEDSRTVSERETALAWEEVAKRCHFMNSIQDMIGF